MSRKTHETTSDTTTRDPSAEPARSASEPSAEPARSASATTSAEPARTSRLQLKMRVNTKTDQSGTGEKTFHYRLSAVDGPENHPWSKFTPSGDLTFTVTNTDAPELDDGGEYLVTLERA